MPFELGLLLGWTKTKGSNNHTWFVFESAKRRLQNSLSDLDGTDPLNHDGAVRGVFRELSNALLKSKYSLELRHMNRIYSHIKIASRLILKQVGTSSLLERAFFVDWSFWPRSTPSAPSPGTDLIENPARVSTRGFAEPPDEIA
jgi:hypothetical protein